MRPLHECLWCGTVEHQRDDGATVFHVLDCVCRGRAIRAVVAAQWAAACIIDNAVTRETNDTSGDCPARHNYAERIMDDVAELPTAVQIVDAS